MNKFLLQLAGISLISGAIYYGLGQVIDPKFWYAHFYYLLILFFIITFLFHLGLTRSLKKGSKDFIRYYMGATGAKLFLFLMIITIYAFINKAGTIAFALGFFFFYLFFTAFEVSIAYTKFGNAAAIKSEEENSSGS
ncbi:hypothetical protein BH11BAC2_BH11BAC2_02930 [soil metagenome]